MGTSVVRWKMASSALCLPKSPLSCREHCQGFLANHKLTRLWGYKYDSERSGIHEHADFAAVNVNFWLTPDEANLNPESGGLVVWDKEAPLDWNFDEYNGDTDRIRRFLEHRGQMRSQCPTSRTG